MSSDMSRKYDSDETDGAKTQMTTRVGLLLNDAPIRMHDMVSERIRLIKSQRIAVQANQHEHRSRFKVDVGASNFLVNDGTLRRLFGAQDAGVDRIRSSSLGELIEPSRRKLRPKRDRAGTVSGI